jgi:hypothetical protein
MPRIIVVQRSVGRPAPVGPVLGAAGLVACALLRTVVAGRPDARGDAMAPPRFVFVVAGMCSLPSRPLAFMLIVLTRRHVDLPQQIGVLIEPS